MRPGFAVVVTRGRMISRKWLSRFAVLVYAMTIYIEARELGTVTMIG